MTRVLVAVEPRMYREVFLATLRRRHPHIEAVLADPASLDRMAERFEPDVVVCSKTTSLVRETVVSWVQVTAKDGLGAEVSVGGRHSTIGDLGIEDLLALVDETEGLLTLRG